MTWFKKKPKPQMITLEDFEQAEKAEKQGRKPKWRYRVMAMLRRIFHRIGL